MTQGITGYGGVNFGSIQGMDLETALMAVQGQRASLLEDQLKDQINAVNDRNKGIADANAAMSDIRNLTAGKNDSAKISLSDLTSETKTTLENLGIKLPTAPDSGNDKGKVTKAALTATLEEIKGKIDAESNNQQMDMLRLQSLSNKRNEAFDLMTNFIKKMNDSRSSVLANMR